MINNCVDWECYVTNCLMKLPGWSPLGHFTIMGMDADMLKFFKN
jgi:hypothetical protein